MTLDELRKRYTALAHAMQSGVAMEMNNPDTKATDPKHLRVGVNAAMSDHGGLVTLLIKKGLITEQEYMEEIVAAMEREKLAYEARISERVGKPVTLG